ncbi:hypothetical protein KSZ12_19725 [Parabacteroides distasonis]|uniref:hypothetical protein n=1 Tax=Parabacteroides distasonis TaxID=823 RepID=UPI001C3931FA|nr:hypothetical protein [Parabacteroides distasonis]MBV4228046.1 hypothetical protein [Parabacteroides distasonis]
MFSNLYSILKHGLKKDSSLPERSSADLPELEIEESLDDLCAQDEEPRIAQDEELANSQKEEYEKAREENERLKDALAALEKELQQAKEEIAHQENLTDVWKGMYSNSNERCSQKDQIISRLEKELQAEKRNECALKQRLREYEEMLPSAPIKVPVYGESYWIKKYNRAMADLCKAQKRADGYKKRVKTLGSKLCQIDGLTGVPDPRKEKLPCFYFAGKCYKGNLRDLEKRLDAALGEEEEKRKQKEESLSRREVQLSDMERQLENRKRLFARIYPDYVWVTRYKDEIERQKKILEGDLKDLAPGFTLEKYDDLLQKKEKYEKEKSVVYRKLDQLKQDRKIFNKERLRFDKEVAEFRQSKTCMEGEISQLLEEYDQLLFVLRSFYKNQGLYERLLDDYLSRIDGAKKQRIVRAYFLGDSVYEIALREGRSREYIRHVLAMVVDVIGGGCM